MKKCSLEERKIERAMRNNARLVSCAIHDFDWRQALDRYEKRKRQIENETGVAFNIRCLAFCRCKNCGGKMLVNYAIPYMDGAKAALKTKNRR